MPQEVRRQFIGKCSACNEAGHRKKECIGKSYWKFV